MKTKDIGVDLQKDEELLNDLKVFVNRSNKEDYKSIAKDLFKNGDLSAVDLFSNAFYGKTVRRATLKSYATYTAHFWTAFLLVYNKTNSLSQSFTEIGLENTNEVFLKTALEHIKSTYDQVDFKELKICPGYSELKGYPIINLGITTLNKPNMSKYLEYTDYIKSL